MQPQTRVIVPGNVRCDGEEQGVTVCPELCGKVCVLVESWY